MTRTYLSSIAHHVSLILRANLLIASAFLLAACNSPATQTSHSDHQRSGQATANPTPRVPAFITDLAAAGPLPAVLDPKQFTDPPVVKAYTYAQQNPEIFAQQPCYCYCDTGEGHKGLLDCFATTHGATWPLCLKEGLLVHKLIGEGKNAIEIRELINNREWQSVKLE